MKRLEIFLPFVGVAVLLAVWSLTVWARVVDPVLLPSPIATFKAMWVGMTSGKLGVDHQDGGAHDLFHRDRGGGRNSVRHSARHVCKSRWLRRGSFCNLTWYPSF